MAQLHTLASGSSANCALLRHGGKNILVDAGIGIRNMQHALGQLHVDIREIDAVVVTHDHTDHVRGLPYLLRYAPDLPIYTSAGTQRRLPALATANFQTIRRGQTFDVSSSVSFTAYEVAHDAQEPLGFRIELAGGPTLGWATDLGEWTDETVEHLRGCEMILLESNYDEYLLRTGRYPAFTKRRIEGNLGHLSNTQARDLLGAVISDDLKKVVLGHLSQNNNKPGLAHSVVSEALCGAYVEVKVAPRKETMEVFDLDEGEAL